MPRTSGKRALLAICLACALSFPRSSCIRVKRAKRGNLNGSLHHASREASYDENVSSIAHNIGSLEKAGVGDLVTDGKVWKHEDSEEHGIDVRRMRVGDAGDRAALKITRVLPWKGERDRIPLPSEFAGDRTLHEIAMFEYLRTKVASASDYLVPFLGAGEVKLRYKDKQVVSLEFQSLRGTLVYRSSCDAGSSPYGYSKADCEMFEKWYVGDNPHGVKYKMMWLLTAYDSSSITILDYLKELLEVKSVAGFSEDRLIERRMKEVANAISACQGMLEKLYDESGFVHADYHLKNMLVAKPRDSILSNNGEVRPDAEPSLPAARLFDLDFSGFVDDATRKVGHRQSTLVESDNLVLNIPMLHALPILDLSTPAADVLRKVLDKEQLISVREVKTDADAATAKLLHSSDMWLGMMQLHEFSTGCDETPLAIELASVSGATPSTAQDEQFHKLVVSNWGHRAGTEATLKKLYRLDHFFESHRMALGEHPSRRTLGFHDAWFRVKMLVKGLAVEQWRHGT